VSSTACCQGQLVRAIRSLLVELPMANGEAVLAVKLCRRLFGSTLTPTVSGGRLAVTLHLALTGRQADSDHP